jgi:hypothetical protein
MNPFLEQVDAWHDFHNAFCYLCKEALVPLVRPNYFVKLDEHVYLHELPADERRLLGRADVAVSHPRTQDRGEGSRSALQAPAFGTIPLAVDMESQSYLEIRDRQDRRLVAAIEVLSPSNKKSGSDREQFIAKRLEFLRSSVHYVEIDLLRGGPRLPLKDVVLRDYYVMVRRMEEWPRVSVWTFSLRDRLPVVPIPLKAPDPDVHLDLQEVLDRVYDAGGYEDYIYARTPEPPLSEEDTQWARQVVQKDAAPGA